MFSRQKKPFEEIMLRRNLKEILTNSDYELAFSKMVLFELDGELKDVTENDHLYNMQQDIMEELIFRQDPLKILERRNPIFTADNGHINKAKPPMTSESSAVRASMISPCI